MGLLEILKAVKQTKSLKNEARMILSKTLEHFPSLKSEYETWSKTFRLNSVACSAYITGQLCYLEGREFSLDKRTRVYVVAAAACIADDLIDKENIDPKTLTFFDSRNHSTPENSQQALFYIFHSELEGLLPKNFKLRFNELIKRCNQAQEQGRSLNTQLKPEEIIEIKDHTGGYPALLLYKITFPDTERIESFKPDYSPLKNTPPVSKEHAIFNLGAMLSRLDDLSDLKTDRENNQRSLASENLVTWKSFKDDVKYTKEGLKLFYPTKKVNRIMKLYSPNLIKLSDSAEKLISKYLN